MTERVVVIGGGQAGGTLVASLREQGYGGEIVLIGEEPHLPYQRPPLSKNFLAGQMRAEQLTMKPRAFYEERNVALKLGTRASAVDPDHARVAVGGGESIEYSTLVFATGSRPRLLQLPGADLPGVHYLRTIDDVEAIRANMGAGRRMVVIGGGYIGLEAAAVAADSDMHVTVVEMAPRILGRVTGETISGFIAAEHRSRGVDIRCGATLVAIQGSARVESVALAEGELPADLVLVGIGILPNVELAQAAGLACENGIVVDEFARTADPRIYAIGDCSNHPNGLIGRRLRLESVQNALDQSRAAAANICGKPRAYNELPWFWSNQYDLRLQMAGISQGYDRTLLRGGVAARSFSVLYASGERLIAADTVNNPREHLALRKIIAQGGAPDLAALADPARPLA